MKQRNRFPEAEACASPAKPFSRRQFVFLAASASAAALLEGCGGGRGIGNAGGGTTPPPSGGSSTFEQRSAALAAFGQHYETLPHQSKSADNQEMLRYLQSRPELRAVQLTESGTVAARFVDGPGFVFINNLDDSRDEDGRSVPVYTSAGRTTRVTDQLPQGSKIFLLNGLSVIPGAGNPLFQFINELRAAAHINKVGEMFSKKGYQTTRDYATIEHLRNLKGVDVFYFIGHGGFGIDENDRKIYVINTSVPVFNKDLDTALAEDIRLDRVGYEVHTGTVDENGVKRRRWKAGYYITPKFVHDHMSFHPNSFVFINGCAGAPPMGTAFQQAFMGRGASAYAGWDEKVNAADVRDSAEFLFDRMLGAGVSDVTGVKQQPPVRPYDYIAAVLEMEKHQRQDQPFSLREALDSEPGSKIAHLRVAANASHTDTFALLAPSIREVTVTEVAKDGLRLSGHFGSDPGGDGSVTVGGTRLAVTSWTPGFITCRLPDPNLHGDVVVTVRGHESNHAQLTLWKGQFKLTMEVLGTSLKQTLTVNAVFRGDVGSYRGNPGEPPHPHPEGGIRIHTHHATGTATADGELVQGSHRSTWKLTKSGELRRDNRDSGVGAWVQIDAAKGVAHLYFLGRVEEGLLHETFSNGRPSGERKEDFSLGTNPAIETKLGQNYTIPGDTRTVDAPAGYPLDGFTARYTASWQDMPALSPPDSSAARSRK